jgi:scyllo-inositol 2-dehydrogenase (NADP+)
MLNTLTFQGSIETIPGNYLLFYDQLFEAIRNGGKLPVKPEESRDVIKLIELCYESSKQKRAIRVD